VKKGHVNYRPLYFLDDLKDGQGQVVRRAVIVHGCTKEGKVDARDVKLAVARRGKFVSDRVGHTFMPGTSEADE
jgi:hypothetical protein